MSTMTITTIGDFINLLNKLEIANISFKLDKYLGDAVSIIITVPGERWEVDIDRNGDVQLEVFRSDGEIFDASKFAEVFCRFSD